MCWHVEMLIVFLWRDFEHASNSHKKRLAVFRMTDRPDPGTYVHYKNGKHYTVIDVVKHSETEECIVLYRAEYGNYGLWVRPLKNFLKQVNLDGQLVARFKYSG